MCSIYIYIYLVFNTAENFPKLSYSNFGPQIAFLLEFRLHPRLIDYKLHFNKYVCIYIYIYTHTHTHTLKFEKDSFKQTNIWKSFLVRRELWFYFLLTYTNISMATHSNTLAWKIPWTEEPGGLQSMGSWRVGHNWATSLSLFTFLHWRRQWQPTPVFLPGESQGRWSLVGCRLWGRIESDTTEAT